MITFMSNLFELNLRFAPHPHAGSKWREICFCNAGSFRFISASEIVLERLTIEIVGFTVPFPFRVPGLRAAGGEHASTGRDRRKAQVTFPAGAPLSEVALMTPPSGNATDFGHQ
jgi:hypothetical protein